MSTSRIYNLTRSDTEKFEESLATNKVTFDYKVTLTDDHWIRFTDPPTQYQIAQAKGRASLASRRLKLLNRLKDKVAQKNKTLQLEGGSQ
jgi:hypothetical protein